MMPATMLPATAGAATLECMTAFGTMNTDILEAAVPGYVRPNLCEYIQNSRFET
jgi:hypothetical protein